MCGIVGMFGPDMPLDIMSKAMSALNYRGEDGAGLALIEKNGAIFHNKAVKFGSVSALSMLFIKVDSYFKDKDGFLAGVGHLRYGTSGDPSAEKNVQPLYRKIGQYEIWLAHNGDTPNFEEMHQELNEYNTDFTTDSDSEFILKYIALAGKEDIIEGIKLGLADYRGTYALIMLIKNGDNIQLIAARDPSGNRPLALGTLNNGYIVASENRAFEKVYGKFIKEINPGEMIIINEKGLKSRSLLNKTNKIHQCVFENIYFSFPSSTVFNLPVWKFRELLGKIAAEKYGQFIEDDDVIANPPDSSNYFADGFCKYRQKPLERVIIRGHEEKIRSFTQPNQEEQENTVREKFSIIREKIAGKRVWILDDSIVRGNTARKLIRSLKKSDEGKNAAWIGFISSAPPIIGPCQKGINHNDNLIAAKYLTDKTPDIDAIRKEIEADFLRYLTIDDLKNAIKEFKEDPNNFCYGCFEGREPIWEVW